MKKTWFITGASRGFGRIWAEVALMRGDQVTATARKLDDVADLTARFGDAVFPPGPRRNQFRTGEASCQPGLHALRQARYSCQQRRREPARCYRRGKRRPDPRTVRRKLHRNVVLRAALPLLRQQGSGHILGVSSGLGITSLPLVGFYCATKWAVEAMHEALAQEVKAFGINVTLVEPAAYATDFGKSAKIADVLEPYADFRKQVMARLNTIERGDPQATSEAILKLVDTENPPLRLGLGTTILSRARAAYERIAAWEAWEDVANAAMGQPKIVGTL